MIEKNEIRIHQAFLHQITFEKRNSTTKFKF